MLTLFRRFSWAGLAPLFALAVVLRAPAWFTGVAGASGGEAAALGPWGAWLVGFDVAAWPLDWLLGTVAVVLIGFYASLTMQHYRIGGAGLVPAVVAIALASAAWWWLGSSVMLAGTFLLAAAAHRLFDGYRHQGAALPVYDCGLLVGAAGLVAPGFLWFGLWAVIALAQLRKFRFSELLGTVFGVTTLPLIAGTYAYVWGDFGAFRQNLLTGLAHLPDPAALQANAYWLAVLAVATLGALILIASLTTRRQIQEQRAARMWYAMLFVGWIPLLFSGTLTPWSLAYVVYPLGLLLGWALAELKRRQGDLVALAVVVIVAIGHIWRFS